MSKGRPKNNLNSPLFSIGAHKDYVLVSGGGGGKNYGLSNTLKVYKNQFPLENPVCELDFDTELMSHLQFPSNGMDYFVAAISKFVAIYQLNPKSGEATEIWREEADFHEKEPEVAKARWSPDNKFIVWGGEEGVMRIYKVNFTGPTQVSGFEMVNELGIHSQGINDVSLSSDNSLAVSSSTDKTCRIYNLKDNKCIKRLSFSEGIGQENLQFKGSIFSPDARFLYTLATRFKGRSYLIKWDAKSENFDPVDTTPVHKGPSWALDLSLDGNYAAVGANDGHVIGVNSNSMSMMRTERKHKMPITNIVFTEDSRSILTVSGDNTYEVMPNASQSSCCGLLFKLWIFLLLIAGIYAAYQNKLLDAYL